MKQKIHTPFITALLKKTLGENTETSKIPVFEVVATSSTPLKKKGIYENAVISPLTMAQMAYAVSKDAIPLMLDHNMEGTPKGKFFYAESQQNDGRDELRGLFYIDPTETDLVAKADLGTLDETSVGFLPSSIKCSACKWDYMAALRAGNVEPLLSKTCENKHTLNRNGVYAIVDGLEDFMELSLVSRGAAPNSKIIGQDNAKLGEQQIEKLAASGFDPNELYLTASASQGENTVDLTELVTKLTDLTAKAALDGVALTAAQSDLTTANTALTASQARVTELEAELVTAKSETAPTEDAAALSAATDFLKSQYVAVLSASGATDVKAPDNVTELLAGIKENHAKLSSIFPVGGVALSANHKDEPKNDEANHLTAFKRSK